MPNVNSNIDRAETILIRQCSLTIRGAARLSSTERAVRNLAALMRLAEIPPERVVIRVKNAAVRSGCGPLHTAPIRYRESESSALMARLVSWAIDAYFDEPRPKLERIGPFSNDERELNAAELRLVAEVYGDLEPRRPELHLE